MKYYLIKNGIIVNAIEGEECPEGFIQSNDKVLMYPNGTLCLESDYDNTKAKSFREVANKKRELAKLQKKLVDTVQKHLDDTAKTRNYDSIVSVCSYATSSNPKFRAEAEACVAWRDAVWAYCYEQLDLYMAGEREVPTDIIAELPPLEW